MTMRSTLRALPFTLLFALSGLALAACGEDDGKSSKSSSSSCDSTFDCSGSSCQCTTDGAQGMACCHPDDCGSNDDNNCNDKCRVCD